MNKLLPVVPVMALACSEPQTSTPPPIPGIDSVTIQGEGGFAAALEIAQNLERQGLNAQYLYKRIFSQMCLSPNRIDPNLVGVIAAKALADADPAVAIELGEIASLTRDEVMQRRHELFRRAFALKNDAIFSDAGIFIARQILNALTEDGKYDQFPVDLDEDIELMQNLAVLLGERELYQIWSIIASNRHFTVLTGWHLHNETGGEPYPPCADAGRHLSAAVPILESAERWGVGSADLTCEALNRVVDTCRARLIQPELGYISGSVDSWPKFPESARASAISRLQAYVGARCRR